MVDEVIECGSDFLGGITEVLQQGPVRCGQLGSTQATVHRRRNFLGRFDQLLLARWVRYRRSNYLLSECVLMGCEK